MSPSALVSSWSSGCHGNSYDSSSRDPVCSLFTEVKFKKKGRKEERGKLQKSGQNWFAALNFTSALKSKLQGRSWSELWRCGALFSSLPAVQMNQSIIKHGDDGEEVTWEEVGGFRRTMFVSCLFQRSLSVVGLLWQGSFVSLLLWKHVLWDWK